MVKKDIFGSFSHTAWGCTNCFLFLIGIYLADLYVTQRHTQQDLGKLSKGKIFLNINSLSNGSASIELPYLNFFTLTSCFHCFTWPFSLEILHFYTNLNNSSGITPLELLRLNFFTLSSSLVLLQNIFITWHIWTTLF